MWKVGFDIDDVAFAAHADLRRIQQLLLGGACDTPGLDAHGVAAAYHLHIAGAGTYHDFFDALGVHAAGTICAQFAAITPGERRGRAER